MKTSNIYFQAFQQESQTQATRSRSRSRSRAISRNSPNNFNSEPVTERPSLTTGRFVNRGSFNRNSQPQDQTSDRDYNPQVVRNLNKFYSDQNEKRKGLFERNKNYCDNNDYDLQSSSDDPPTHITVTHTIPLATNINNFLLPSVTSVQLINVGELRSTDISSSPVIFANTKTAFQEVLYDALRAKEEVENTYITTCYNGRQTVFSKQTTQTIYSVETVTSSLAPAPGLQTPELEDLLAKFLTTAAPALPSQARLEVTSTEVTQTITHSSTYITQVSSLALTSHTITLARSQRQSPQS